MRQQIKRKECKGGKGDGWIEKRRKEDPFHFVKREMLEIDGEGGEGRELGMMMMMPPLLRPLLSMLGETERTRSRHTEGSKVAVVLKAGEREKETFICESCAFRADAIQIAIARRRRQFQSEGKKESVTHRQRQSER